MDKFKIILIDISKKKEEMVMEGEYTMEEFLQAGQSFCDEFRYDTFRVEKVIKKSSTRTKKSKKS